MPELPEVETVRRDLLRRLVGVRITGVWTSGLPLRMRRPVDQGALVRVTVGHDIRAVRRRAKYLLLELAKGTVVVHLGMTGRLVVAEARSARPTHTHVVWSLGAGKELRFIDARRFGAVTVWPAHRPEPAELARLGIDPISETLTIQALAAQARTCRMQAKQFLLDQRKIAGLGNIYVCEALHRAKIHPGRRMNELTRIELDALRKAIVRVLRQAIANRGTTLRDYRDGEGRAGRNQFELLVYGREGEPCPTCRRPIHRIVQQGRSSFFCTACTTRP